jgi:hypothetical protein
MEPGDQGIGALFRQIRDFSVLHMVQTCAAHPTAYPVSTMACFRRVKGPAREADNPPPSRAEVKNGWSNTSDSPILHAVVFSSVQGQVYLRA